MKKIIRMTESDLTNLVKRVIEEQSAQIKSVDNVKTAPKQSTGQLIKSVDNVKAATPKQSMGTISSVMMKEDPKEWFSNFPCIKNLPADQQKIVGGKIYIKDMDGKRHVFLPESGRGTGYDREDVEAIGGYLGKIQGKGVYYCHSAAYAKGMGPVLAI
jgi:hypothetical protein